MNTESLVSMFKLAGTQKLYVTMLRPSGEVWANGVPCIVGFPQFESSTLPTIGINPEGESGYHTDFPVEKIESTTDGQTVLVGPKGSAVFRVIGNA